MAWRSGELGVGREWLGDQVSCGEGSGLEIRGTRKDTEG